MGHVRDLWHDGKGERTTRYGKGKRYEARYVDPTGKPHSRSFANRDRSGAVAFLATIEADKVRGSYIDPASGRVALRTIAEQWLSHQTFDRSTWEATERRLRRHVFPALGDLSIKDIKPSVIQSWLKGLEHTVSPDYARIALGNLSAILAAAVEDDLLVRNPCRSRSIRQPSVREEKVVPWTEERVAAMHAATPLRYAVSLTLGACCGMRQGEVLGLAVEDIDFLRGWVHIERQVKIVGNALVFALPKGQKKRKVPLSEPVALELAAHIAAFPPTPVTLPWVRPGGDSATASLLLTNGKGRALYRHLYNEVAWRPARLIAGVPGTRENGFHALRHFFASALLDAGENINALAEWLGHRDPGFTLRKYTHLMPSSEKRTRSAISAMFDRTFRTSEGTEKGRGLA